jgi:hypothetical protein
MSRESPIGTVAGYGLDDRGSVPCRDRSMFLFTMSLTHSLTHSLTLSVIQHVSGALQVEVFWTVTPCIAVVRHKRFGGPCCFHLQGEGGDSMDF